MSIEAMKRAMNSAIDVMESASQRIDELKAENASLRQSIEQANVTTNDTLQERVDEIQEQRHEPVAWMFQHEETGRMNYVSNDGMNTPELFLKMNPRYVFVCALYTSPPQRPKDIEQQFIDDWNAGKVRRVFDGAKPWVGLTDDDEIPWDGVDAKSFARAIEAKLKDKNCAG